LIARPVAIFRSDDLLEANLLFLAQYRADGLARFRPDRLFLGTVLLPKLAVFFAALPKDDPQLLFLPGVQLESLRQLIQRVAGRRPVAAPLFGRGGLLYIEIVRDCAGDPAEAKRG